MHTNTITEIQNFATSLQAIIEKGLPGFEAQKKMSPSIREHILNPHDKKLAKDSGVLLLLYRKNNRIYIPFILRTTGKIKHSGQISFPGGKCELSDADYTATALRETYEELGVDPHKVNIIGRLTELYIPVSNFMVHPIIGYTDMPPKFCPNPSEVANIIEVPVNELLHDSNIDKFNFTTNGFNVTAPYFNGKGHKIWGATAMILSELKELLHKNVIK